MINNAEYYRRLVTSQYRHSPRFIAMVDKIAGYGVDADEAADNIISAFNPDTATTSQLDIIGTIVGVSRDLSFEPSAIALGDIICPMPEEIASGEEYPIIYIPEPEKAAGTEYLSGFAVEDMKDGDLLDDDVFRLIIKARIIQNAWKGTLPELYELWQSVFPQSKVMQIQDLQDMSYNIVMQGDYSALEKELILHGYIIPKPEGVRINILTFVDVDGLPLFSYDYNTMTYSGYESYWAKGERNGKNKL